MSSLTYNDTVNLGITTLRGLRLRVLNEEIAKFKHQLAQANKQGWPSKEIEAGLAKVQAEQVAVNKASFSVETDAVCGFAYFAGAEYRRVVGISSTHVTYENNENDHSSICCPADEWLRWLPDVTKIANHSEKYNVRDVNLDSLTTRAKIEYEVTKPELIAKGVSKERKHTQ